MKPSVFLTVVAVALLVLAFTLAFLWQRGSLHRLAFTPTQRLTSLQPLPPNGSSAPDQASPDIETLAENLEIPWEIAFLPQGELLITERPGRLIKIGQNQTAIPIQGVRHIGEGGLLGLALHPDFSANHLLYLYFTLRPNQAEPLINRVVRYQLSGDTLTNETTIIDNIPGSQFHDGGRIAFGPDGLLYIATGDAGNSDAAQDTRSLAGKILRLHDDGSIPAANPFQNAVYSYGHRNPQGLAWDATGNLWATEHGRSGVQSGLDEINLIEMGANYGWPVIQGDETRPNMKAPVAHSGPNQTWAPSGAVILNGHMFFAGLRGEALYRATLSRTDIAHIDTLYSQQFGRLRAVSLGPDGHLYLLTNNRDGRGSPRAGDDKLIRVRP